MSETLIINLALHLACGIAALAICMFHFVTSDDGGSPLFPSGEKVSNVAIFAGIVFFGFISLIVVFIVAIQETFKRR